jgi:hypothetical protein
MGSSLTLNSLDLAGRDKIAGKERLNYQDQTNKLRMICMKSRQIGMLLSFSSFSFMYTNPAFDMYYSRLSDFYTALLDNYSI